MITQKLHGFMYGSTKQIMSVIHTFLNFLLPGRLPVFDKEFPKKKAIKQQNKFWMQN